MRRKFDLKWDLFEKLTLKDTDRWGKTKREDSSKRHFFPMEKITQHIHSRKNWTMREKVHRAIDCIRQRANKKKEHKIILPLNTLWAEIGREHHKMHHRRFPHFHPRIFCHLPIVWQHECKCALVFGWGERKFAPGAQGAVQILRFCLRPDRSTCLLFLTCLLINLCASSSA